MTARSLPTSASSTLVLRFLAVALMAALAVTPVFVGLLPWLAGIGGLPPDDPPPPIASPTVTPSPTTTPEIEVPTREPMPTAVPSAPATPTPTVLPTPAPATPAPEPTPPGTGNVLPICAYMDVLTLHHGYDDWPITLLDTIYHLPAWYAPADLVDSSAAGLNGGYLVRRFLVGDLAEMAAAARAAGAPIQLVSGYRSHAQQQATFDHWVRTGGYDQALRTSARAGHSEHQLGTAIDVTSEGGVAPWNYGDWADTAAGSWMAANAWRYGFVMSYPRGGFDRTCYDYEPWHYRYVGRSLAAEITANGRTPREVIWTKQ